MDNEILHRILNCKSEKLTGYDIEKLMDEELEKEPEKMDADLVEICIDALNSKVSKSIYRMKLKKAIAIGAVITLLVTAVAIPVTAKYVHINASADVVKYCNECFIVDL